jgi:hypothetical protein
MIKFSMGIFLDNHPDYYLWLEFRALYNEVSADLDTFLAKINKYVFDKGQENLRQQSIVFSETEERLLENIRYLMTPKLWEHFQELFEEFIKSGASESTDRFSLIFTPLLPELMSKKSRAQETREKEHEEVLDSLVSFRASGLTNAQTHFDPYLKELKRLFPYREWDLYALGEFLQQGFTFRKDGKYYLEFIRTVLGFLENPLIRYLANGSEINIVTEINRYYFQLSAPRYGSNFDFLGASSKSFSRSVTKGIGSLSLKSFKSWIEIFIEESPGEKSPLNIVSCEFSLRKYRGEFTNLLSWLYSEPNLGELIPLWFKHWEFFNFGLTCEGCGRLITHPVSAAKGRGPICGNHGYKYGAADTPKILNLVRRSGKQRILSNGSPLIADRLNRVNDGLNMTDQTWLKLLSVRKELSEGELYSLINLHQ